MKLLRARRQGFTLVELIVVIGIIAFLTALVVGGLAIKKSGVCTKLLTDMKTVVSDCDTALDNGGVDGVASCLDKAQKAIDAWCNEGCGGIPSSAAAIIDGVNKRIPAYKEGLTNDQDKAKIHTLNKPC